jgi:hypothetical protein
LGGGSRITGGLEVKVQGVETTAFLHRTPELASLRKIMDIASDHDMGIKRVTALPAIAIGIIQARFVLFGHTSL